MNDRYLSVVGQKDRELEELLCLAYLFTHSVYAEAPDDCEILDIEILAADYGDLSANFFCN